MTNKEFMTLIRKLSEVRGILGSLPGVTEHEEKNIIYCKSLLEESVIMLMNGFDTKLTRDYK